MPLLSLLASAGCSEGNDPPTNESVYHEARIDTDAGTWINLDVSPDGKLIAFDLLGDIFVLPIAGGDAIPLVEGRAWENLPAFSPDGREVAFTSDRSGVQNIWAADARSGELRQVTEEERHLPSGPAWSADGQFIAVRRHFAAKRTVGAGEIWLYPSGGGSGRAVIERHSTQKDINEPRFSADGRFLYYSEDVWPGAAFAYNKDPSLGIYAVMRRDLETSESEVIVRIEGGAVRPTPSPDGKLLAYVTRRGAKSALVVRDLVDGGERVIKSDLDRDLQAVWANHGVYPAMDWMPDGTAIVLWSGGKIVRVSVDDGEATNIPFRVQQTFDVTEPPMPTFKVPKRQFGVRALRWASMAPDGKTVAFQALGRIYLHDLETRDSKPIQRESGTYEFYPVFSPDGQWILYTTWRDGTMGDIRRTNLKTGETMVLTVSPGVYLDLAVSPDQTRIAFRRSSGSPLIGNDTAGETGIYWMPWSGGTAERVSGGGVTPSFCNNGDRVFFVRRKSIEALPPHDEEWLNHARFLVSRDLSTGTEVEHADVGLSTELKLSPDCKWLAWIRYSTVRATSIDITAEEPTRVEDTEYVEAQGDGGGFVSWSDDETLRWTLGPMLYTWRPGDSDTPPTVVDLGFDANVADSDGKWVLKGGRIVTMGPSGTIENGWVVVDGERIIAVGSGQEMDVPAGATTIDVSGKTIVPGFIDSHWHGLYTAEGINPQANWILHAGLAFGITTVFDPFAASEDVFAVSELGRAGTTLAPRIFSTGTPLYGAHNDFTAQIGSLEDARRAIRRRKAFGAIAVKTYLLPAREQQQRVIAAARELNVRVIAEQSMATPAIMAQVFDGHTSVEHNLPYEVLYDDITQAWSDTNVDHTPTLTVLLGGLWPSSYWLAHREFYPRNQLLRYLPEAYLESKRSQPGSQELASHGFPVAAEQVSKLHDAGVRILPGAHAEIIGLGYHWELWMLHGGGMSAEDVIRAGTIDAARHLGLSADLGSIEPGKLADLVILDGNPLRDIRETTTVRYIVVSGRLLDVETMASPRH